MFKNLNLIALIALTLVFAGCKRNYLLESPDTRLEVSITVTPAGEAQFSVKKDLKPLLNTSLLGLKLWEEDWTHSLLLKEVTRTTHNDTWLQPWGQQTEVINHYNELAMRFKNRNANDSHQLIIRFRCFNDGIAFRYEFLGENDSLQIIDEQNTYRFAQDPQLWSIPYNTPYYEGLWQKRPLSEINDTVCSPITMELPNGTYICMHEANLTDYGAQNFFTDTTANRQTELKTYITPWSTGVKVYGKWGKMVSPWRTFIIADNLNELATSNLLVNLNEPCKIEDTSWIMPMKYMGIWWSIHLGHHTWSQGPNHGATTENMKKYIKFCAEHGIKGLLAEGWNYGWDGDWSGEGFKMQFNKPYPDFNIEKIAEYAEQNGVNIIGHNETGGWTENYESQLDETFAFCNKYNIHAVKTGYVNPLLDGKELHKSQYGVRHMRRVVEKAAEAHIMIDNHECVMPTGLCRTYPNLMTGEAVRGQEWDAWSVDGGSPAEHLTVLPFTRQLAGPVDFTPGTFDFSNPKNPQTRVHSTLARQLALYVVLYSPLQMLSDMPESYSKHPDAFRFLEQVPVDWSKSYILDGKIGDFVVTARKDRHSDDWYIGAINDEQARELHIPLSDILDNGAYHATVYRSTPQTDWQDNPYELQIEQAELTKTDTLHIHLRPADGYAVQLKKNSTEKL